MSALTGNPCGHPVSGGWLVLGFFTPDYESAGVGIAKNAPKKKGAALFFEIFKRKFWNLIEVNMLYSVFYIPLVLSFVAFFSIDNTRISIIVSILLLIVFAFTVGPATAGMTKILRNYVLEKHSFIIHDFFKAFKENFARSSIIGFIDLLICISIGAGFIIYPILAAANDSVIYYVFLVLSLSVFIVVVMMNFYIFLMMIATDLSIKDLIKNSFALTFVAMKKNIITFVIVSIILAAFAMLPIFVSLTFLLILPFFPAAIVWMIVCFNSYPVIQKYVINPYYTSIGQINPELCDDTDDEETIFEDMGGKEKPIEKRKKGKGKRRIS